MSSSVKFVKGLLRALAFYLLYVSRQLLDRFLNLLFESFYRALRPQPRLPRPRRSLLSLSASRLAHKIRTRQLTAETVVTVYVERITEVDPLLHCVAENRFTVALEEARAADAEIRRLHSELSAAGESVSDPDWSLVTRLKTTRPLLGVPFAAHETAAARGMHMTGGLPRRRDRVSDRDAAVVAALRAAGGILVATTSGAEADAWWESSSALHGTVRLPHDLRRSPGGPGGGAAALLAAAACPLAVGADAGGALRTPAAFCGLFGHAASPELVSTAGLGLEPEDEHVQAAGALCRHAEDLAMVLRLLARGPVAMGRLRESVPAARLRVFTAEPPPLLTVSVTSRHVRAALRTAGEALRERGATVERLLLPEAADALAMLAARLADERPGWSVAGTLASGGPPVSVWRELAAWPLGRSQLTLPSLLQCLLAGRRRPDQLRRQLDQCRQLQRRLTDLLDTDGVLLYPAHPTAAPLLFQSYTRPLNVLPTLLFAALGLPTCVVPCGLSPAGLPLAVQVVAAPGADHLCLAAVEVLQTCGGHVEPPWADDEVATKGDSPVSETTESDETELI